MFKTITSSLDLKKNPSQEEIRKISSYIFCRWLSGNKHAIQAANMINLYSDIPIENQYNMVKAAFGGKIKFIPYPKNASEASIKSIEYLSMYFNISLEKAKEYLTLISKDELKQIVDMYTEQESKR